MDAGCNQTSIHQSLIQVRCVHGDVVRYPLMSVAIQFRRQMHIVELAVNLHFRHPIILGTNWSAFSQLLRYLCANVSWENGEQGGKAVAQVGEP